MKSGAITKLMVASISVLCWNSVSSASPLPVVVENTTTYPANVRITNTPQTAVPVVSTGTTNVAVTNAPDVFIAERGTKYQPWMPFRFIGTNEIGTIVLSTMYDLTVEGISAICTLNSRESLAYIALVSDGYGSSPDARFYFIPVGVPGLPNIWMLPYTPTKMLRVRKIEARRVNATADATCEFSVLGTRL